MRQWMTGTGPTTHVLMDGGILHVDNPDLFHRQYIDSIKRGHKLYVVELKTEVFRFFVDIDYKGPKPLEECDIIHLIKTLNKVTKSRCFISLSEPRRLSDGQIKTGIHVHWPGILVTKQDAIKLRTKMIIQCPEANEWLDASVYAGSGLRLVWSYKKDTPDCPPYKPWKTIKGDSVSPLPCTPSLDLLLLFSIRTEHKETRPEDSSVSSSDYSRLEQFIQTHLEGQATSIVYRVFKTRDRKSLCVQTDSRFCEKEHREHKRNHVWFWIRKGTICQMCLDEDHKAFQGREYKLPPSILEELKDAPEDPCGDFCFRDAFSIR